MPKGPKGQRRPADVIGNAIKVARIATGEEQEDMPKSDKDPNAASLGKKGGVARAKALSPEKRSEIAKKAAAKRWATKKWIEVASRGISPVSHRTLRALECWPSNKFDQRAGGVSMKLSGWARLWIPE